MKTRLKNSIGWTIVNVCRFLLALTFIFSGTVKLIDPLGTAYKIEDYALAFGLASLLPSYSSVFLSIGLALFEFGMGMYMFFGTRRLRTTRLLLLFLLLVIPLTLYIAIKNPVQDCGCFGDAWVLSNWQTFVKNLILLAACVVVVWHPEKMTRFISERNQWMVSVYSWIFGLVLALVCLYRLPIVDFRPYSIGSDILQKMALKEDDSELKTFFLMEKDGVQKEFTLENYPDSTWQLVDTRTEGKDYAESKPEIDDLAIVSVESGEDITYTLLNDTAYKFLLVAPYLEMADDGAMDRISALCDYCRDYGYQFLGLTSSGTEVISHWQDITGGEYPFFQVDEIPLKTMVRSNPGLILLHGSTVVAKWPSSSFPKEQELVAPLEELSFSHPDNERTAKGWMKLILWYLIPLALCIMADRLWALWMYRKNR